MGIWMVVRRRRLLALAGVGCLGLLLFWRLLCPASDRAVLAEEGETIQLPVLMYHHMLQDSRLLGDYCIRPADFEADLRRIREEGYTTISIAELLAWADGQGELPRHPILLTFDDGYESTYTYAYPLLRQYGMKAVVSIIGRYTDQYSESDDHHLNYAHLTWAEARAMQASGLVELMNHSYDLHSNTHRRGMNPLLGEDPEAYRQLLLADIGGMQAKLEGALGTRPAAFAYPFGYRCEAGDAVLRSLGFRVLLGCEEGINHLTRQPGGCYRLRRYNRALTFDMDAFFASLSEGSEGAL